MLVPDSKYDQALGERLQKMDGHSIRKPPSGVSQNLPLRRALAIVHKSRERNFILQEGPGKFSPSRPCAGNQDIFERVHHSRFQKVMHLGPHHRGAFVNGIDPG